MRATLPIEPPQVRRHRAPNDPRMGPCARNGRTIPISSDYWPVAIGYGIRPPGL